MYLSVDLLEKWLFAIQQLLANVGKILFVWYFFRSLGIIALLVTFLRLALQTFLNMTGHSSTLPKVTKGTVGIVSNFK